MYDDNVYQTYCGEHFAEYTDIKELCYTPETNIMMCQLIEN